MNQGTICALNDSQVTFDGTIVGGTLTTSGSGTIAAGINGGRIKSLTNMGCMSLSSNLGLDGTIVNSGSIVFNSASLLLPNNASLIGSGTVHFNAPAGLSGGTTSTLNNSNYVRGLGSWNDSSFKGQFTNEVAGTIDADVAGSTFYLLFASKPLINHGTLHASNGGRLFLELTTNDGWIRANPGSMISTSSTITGGTISTSAGATIASQIGTLASAAGKNLWLTSTGGGTFDNTNSGTIAAGDASIVSLASGA